MIVTEEHASGRYQVALRRDDGDEGAGATTPHRTSLVFHLPGSWSADDTHPDLLAAALLLSLRPFVGSDLVLPRAVSPGLASAVAEQLGIRVGPVDEALAPRTVERGRPGLAFSGGVDSCAALMVLGPDTCCVFLDRLAPEDDERVTAYRPEAARAALEHARGLGRDTVSVASDVEYLREKVGFPVFDASSVESNGAPVVLLADHLQLGCLSFGTIAEVCYGTGYGPFVDHGTHPVHRAWREVLAAAGLPVLLPLAGVSEIGTTKIVAGSEWDGVAQSCIRGRPGDPCLDCVKCVRKTLVHAAVTGQWPDPAEVDRLLLVREFRRRLYESPVPLTEVYRYAMARCPEPGEIAGLLRRRWAVNDSTGGYLERWYHPSARTWPREMSGSVAAELDNRLGRMRKPGVRAMRRWDPAAAESTPAAAALALALARHLDLMTGEEPRDELVPGRNLRRELGLDADGREI